MELDPVIQPPNNVEKAVSGGFSEVDPVAMSPLLGNQETTPGPLPGSGSVKLKQEITVNSGERGTTLIKQAKRGTIRLLFPPTTTPPQPMTIAIATDDGKDDATSRQENPLSFPTKERVTTVAAEKEGETVTPMDSASSINCQENSLSFPMDEKVTTVAQEKEREHVTSISDEPGRDKSNIIPKPKNKLTKAEREVQRAKRETLRAEREAQKAEKERERVEARAKKEAEKTKKEQERKEKREQREKEREQEKREKKERREKQEAERKKKEDEKKRKDEEKKQELEQAKQEQQRKEKIAKDRFIGFFSKLPNTSTKKESPTRPDFNIITPFPVQPNMTIAQSPSSPRDMTHLCNVLVSQNSTSTYLEECALKKTCSNMGKVLILSDDDDDVMIVSPSTQGVKRSKFKLLQFHENYRPAYWGTWRKKKSVLISPRSPFRKDEGLLDYDGDSDDEWEEEEPGESLSNSEGEGQCEGGSGEESEGEEDGFFVPHGYLSDDEGEQSDGEMTNGIVPDSGDYRKQKQLAKAKAWEAEYARKCQPLKVVKIGCIWSQKGDSEGLSRQEAVLRKFAAMVLVDVPIHVKTCIERKTQQDNHAASSESNKPKQVPGEALPDLIRLVHKSPIGLTRLIRIFRVHWGAKVKEQSNNPTEHTPATPKTTHSDDAEYEKASGISKRQLEIKILAIATKEQRPPNPKPLWYVHESVLRQHHLDTNNLTPFEPLVTPSSERKVQSCEKPRQVSPETPCGSKKGLKRRGEGIPSVKALFEVLAKSPEGISSNVGSPGANSSNIRPPGAISTNVGPPPYKRQKLEDTSSVKNVANQSTTLEPPLKKSCLEREASSENVIIIVSDDSLESNNTKENVTVPTCVTTDWPMACTAEEPHLPTRALQECTNSWQNPPTLEHNVPEGIDWCKITMENNINTIVVRADVH